jgi:O-antigen/teichoic acid export membrane protein
MIAMPTGGSASRIMRNVVALAIAQCITWSASTVAIIFLPRYLGSADLGRYTLAFLCVSILTIVADLGVSTYVTKQTPRGDRVTAGRLGWNAVGLGITMSLAVALVGSLLVHFLVRDPSTRVVFFLLIVSLPLQTMYVRTSASLRGVQEMAPIAWAEGISKCLAVVLIVGLLITGHGVQAVCIATVAGALVALIISGAAFRRRFRYIPPALPTWKLLIAGGLPFVVWQASLQIYGQIDIVILSILSTDSAVGWYSAAYRLISVPIFAPVIIIGAAFPAISSAAAREPSQVAFIAKSALRACLAITVPMSVAMVVLSERLVDLLAYPSDFDNMIPLVAILALHVPMVGATMVIASCLYSLDSQWSWVKIGIAAAILNPVMNIPLIPLTQHFYDNGAIGAALVTVLTEGFMLLAGLCLLPATILGRPALKDGSRIVLAGVLMGLVILPLRHTSLVGIIAVGAVVYVLALLLLRTMSLEECKNMALLLRGRGGGREAKPARLDDSWRQTDMSALDGSRLPLSGESAHNARDNASATTMTSSIP